MVSATRAAKDPDWAFVPLGAVFLSLSEMWHMSKPVKKDGKRVLFFEFFGHTWNMSKPVMTFVFKVLRNRLLRYTYLKHVQTCDDVRVQSATPSTASVYILETCPNLWWRSCSKCYAIDCFGIHTWNMSKPVMTFVFKVLRHRLLRYMSKPVMTFVFKVLRNRLLRYTYLEHDQTCDDVRVQSATQSTASVHTWNMSKPVMTFVFKVLRNRLLRYILETCPWSRMLCNPVKRCISCT